MPTNITDHNQYLLRLQRVLTMHTGLVVHYEDIHRRVFADQAGAHWYCYQLVNHLRFRGWQIETHIGVGLKLVAKPARIAA